MENLSPGFTRAASVAVVDGSIRTRKNPVGVSLTVTNGLGGSGIFAEDVATFGVGVAEGAIVPVGLATGCAPPGESPSFIVTMSR